MKSITEFIYEQETLEEIKFSDIKKKAKTGYNTSLGFIKKKAKTGYNTSLGFIKDKSQKGYNTSLGFIKKKAKTGYNTSLGFIKDKATEAKDSVLKGYTGAKNSVGERIKKIRKKFSKPETTDFTDRKYNIDQNNLPKLSDMK